MSSVKIVAWPRGAPLTNVPDCLEKLASEMRAGRIPAEAAVVVLADGDHRLAEFGYGRIGTVA